MNFYSIFLFNRISPDGEARLSYLSLRWCDIYWCNILPIDHAWFLEMESSVCSTPSKFGPLNQNVKNCCCLVHIENVTKKEKRKGKMKLSPILAEGTMYNWSPSKNYCRTCWFKSENFPVKLLLFYACWENENLKKSGSWRLLSLTFWKLPTRESSTQLISIWNEGWERAEAEITL